MNPREIRLRTAVDAHNADALAEFADVTGLWHLPRGGVHLVGSARVRALFVDKQGELWCDGVLFAESYPFTRAERGTALDMIADLDRCHDLHVMTLARGMHNALVVPVDAMATRFHLGHELVASGGWARGWEDSPRVTDAQYLALA